MLALENKLYTDTPHPLTPQRFLSGARTGTQRPGCLTWRSVWSGQEGSTEQRDMPVKLRRVFTPRSELQGVPDAGLSPAHGP